MLRSFPLRPPRVAPRRVIWGSNNVVLLAALVAVLALGQTCSAQQGPADTEPAPILDDYESPMDDPMDELYKKPPGSKKDKCGEVVRDDDGVFEGQTYASLAQGWMEWAYIMQAIEHPLVGNDTRTSEFCTLLNNAGTSQILFAGGKFESGSRLDPTRIVTLNQGVGRRFFLPCGKVKRGECSNPELRNPDGTFKSGQIPVKNVRLRVQKDDVTKDVFKNEITTTPWFPVYYVEGGIDEGLNVTDLCGSETPPPNCISDFNSTELGLKYNHVWRDNTATAGICALLDLRSCKQRPGDTFRFRFAGDFVSPSDPGTVIFGFEKVVYKFKFV